MSLSDNYVKALQDYFILHIGEDRLFDIFIIQSTEDWRRKHKRTEKYVFVDASLITLDSRHDFRLKKFLEEFDVFITNSLQSYEWLISLVQTKGALLYPTYEKGKGAILESGFEVISGDSEFALMDAFKAWSVGMPIVLKPGKYSSEVERIIRTHDIGRIISNTSVLGPIEFNDRIYRHLDLANRTSLSHVDNQRVLHSVLHVE